MNITVPAERTKGQISPTLFMSASTATPDTPLRQAWLRIFCSQAGRLASRDLDILFQVCLGLSRLRMPVSSGVSLVSSQTVMNNVGLPARSGILALMPRNVLRKVFFCMMLIGNSGLFPGESPAQVIKSGPSTCPGVALTFDLCPVRKGPGYDQPLMDYLITHRIPATFFMSGKWIAKHHTDVTHLLGLDFFEVGTHGDVHAHLPMHDADEQRTEILGPVKMLQEHYAHQATLFRPPYGEYNDLTVATVNLLGLQFIQWNIESGDPDPTLSAEQILTRVSKRMKPGSIIVFHANGKGKQTRQVIEQLTSDVLPQKGLRPMTVSELLACQSTP